MIRKKTSKAVLKQRLQQARAELDRIEKREAQRRNKKLIGKCFKYRNSYNSEEHWWLYLRVTGVDGYWPEVIRFQRPPGRFELETKDIFSSQVGYVEISTAEYEEAWSEFLAVLRRIQ